MTQAQPQAMTALTRTPAWTALAAHARDGHRLDIMDLRRHEQDRGRRLSFTLEGGLSYDLTCSLASQRTFDLLLDFARQQDVAGNFAAMMAGEKLNVTEDRAAWHTALRAPDAPAEVVDALARMRAIAGRIRADKTITDVIHIGIGGSDLGPRLACAALRRLIDGPRVHFVSTTDSETLRSLMAGVKPENVAVIAASKTFTTAETVQNIQAVRQWLGFDAAADTGGRFIAVTANVDAARAMNIADGDILPFWDWVCGRFSVWSAVGLPLMVACGPDVFDAFLKGAHAADNHVSSMPLDRNVPVLRALLCVWYRNFMGFGAHAVLPYSQRLALLPSYMQQLEMESNGKRIDRQGRVCDYKTAGVTFGAVGTNAQHTFMQLLHQGMDIIPCDFIGLGPTEGREELTLNMRAQIRALAEGGGNTMHAITPGNRPSTAIILPRLDPFSLGQFMALEEHKTAALGFLWNINSFDQFGVELGKALVKEQLAQDRVLTHNKS